MRRFATACWSPFAREVLLFFDQHYPRGADGKLRLDPAQVLETWWIAVNPAPDVAGLRFCLDELLAMKAGTAEDQARWQQVPCEIPEVPSGPSKAAKRSPRREMGEATATRENGELYPVFPFRCFGLAVGIGDLVNWTMKHRSYANKRYCSSFCWHQEEIHQAYAGNAVEAAAGLEDRFRSVSTECRFPLYAGQMTNDGVPDFDHFGSGSIALQRMLVQEENGKILLLPAWPSDWDVDFKLHLTGGGVITGTVKEGRLLAWDIQPSSRKKDVVVHQPQGKPVVPVTPPSAQTTSK